MDLSTIGFRDALGRVFTIADAAGARRRFENLLITVT